MRKPFLFVCLALTVALSSCDSNKASETVVIEGNYVLHSVGGQTLPATILQFLNDRIEITAGNVELRADSTFIVALTIRTTESGMITTDSESDHGTYTVLGTTLTLTYSDETVDNATLAKGELTVLSNGLTLVFRK